MGMIAAILGPLFLIIKRNGEQLVEPYTEQPEKKRTHFLKGFLLSIGLVILYLPLIFGGVILGLTVLGWHGWGLDVGPFILIIIIGLNSIIGVLIFFLKEKLRYISRGIITFLLGSLALIVFLWFNSYYDWWLYFT